MVLLLLGLVCCLVPYPNPVSTTTAEFTMGFEGKLLFALLLTEGIETILLGTGIKLGAGVVVVVGVGVRVGVGVTGKGSRGILFPERVKESLLSGLF